MEGKFHVTTKTNYSFSLGVSGTQAWRMRGSGLQLCQGRFILDIRRSFFKEKVVKHWNSLPREVVESPFLGVFIECVGMALQDML